MAPSEPTCRRLHCRGARSKLRSPGRRPAAGIVSSNFADISTKLRASYALICGPTWAPCGQTMPALAIASATSKGLEAALKVALRTLPSSPRSNSQFLHRALATASGAAGGTFGLAALPVELPVSTTIMLRSIADIARSEGEDLSDPETALACVEVFALG